MASVCSVSGCTTGSKSRNKLISSEKEIPRIHRFPKDPIIQKLWVSACRKNRPINISYGNISYLNFFVIKLHTYIKTYYYCFFYIICYIFINFFYVCSLHFSYEDYFQPLIQKMLNYSPQNCRKLKADAIPTLNLPGE
ncbi:uncharacterized protein LOC132934837 [Metopolophium dirhodum]|uniref:uncharacterized protein LOC132934837 n=1 Tax=Metopolophium dirhodum TaxID=44670 RepID=UPI0029905485|nr:uncharacterized protein LOC132934837 [Metopolophium dirhodum]